MKREDLRAELGFLVGGVIHAAEGTGQLSELYSQAKRIEKRLKEPDLLDDITGVGDLEKALEAFKLAKASYAESERALKLADKACIDALARRDLEYSGLRDARRIVDELMDAEDEKGGG